MSFLILSRTVNKLSTNYSRLLLYLSYTIIAFNGAVFCLLGGRGVYYESIAAGQLFFLIGILTAFKPKLLKCFLCPVDGIFRAIQ